MKFEGKDGVIDHFLMDVRARGRGELTLVTYTQRLTVLARLLLELYQMADIEQVKVIHLRGCVQHLLDHGAGSVRGRRIAGDTMDANSVRGYVRVWKVFFNWCFQEELIDTNVVARLRAPQSIKRVIPAFTVEHVEKMLSTCDISTDIGYRNYVIILLFLDTGMRLSELSRLNVDSIHERFVKVFGKGRKEREIGIRPEISKLLWKYVQKYRHASNVDEKALFIAQHGRRIGVEGIKAIIRVVKRESGIEDVRVSPHTFRHTFAKWYLKNGGELFKLSRELGHSGVKITETYLQDFDSSDARDDHDSFSPISLLQLGQKRKKRKDKVE